MASFILIAHSMAERPRCLGKRLDDNRANPNEEYSGSFADIIKGMSGNSQIARRHIFGVEHSSRNYWNIPKFCHFANIIYRPKGNKHPQPQNSFLTKPKNFFTEVFLSADKKL